MPNTISTEQLAVDKQMQSEAEEMREKAKQMQSEAKHMHSEAKKMQREAEQLQIAAKQMRRAAHKLSRAKLASAKQMHKETNSFSTEQLALAKQLQRDFGRSGKSNGGRSQKKTPITGSSNTVTSRNHANLGTPTKSRTVSQNSLKMPESPAPVNHAKVRTAAQSATPDVTVPTGISSNTFSLSPTTPTPSILEAANDGQCDIPHLLDGLTTNLGSMFPVLEPSRPIAPMTDVKVDETAASRRALSEDAQRPGITVEPPVQGLMSSRWATR